MNDQHPIPILNPSWVSICNSFFNVPSENMRAKKWVEEMLFPYIEKHPEEFCLEVMVDSFRPSPDEDYFGERVWEIEGFALIGREDRARGLNLTMGADPYIRNLTTTYENREFAVPSPGWRAGSGDLAPQVLRQRSDTRVTILLTNFLRRTSMDVVYLFSAHLLLVALLDWLAYGAKVPLTVTKLPFKEAKRLSDEWHARMYKRKAKELEKAAKNPGDRHLVGRLTVVKDASIPEATYEVFWLKDMQSLKYESALQHHCVDGYWPRVASRNSVILHLKNVDPKAHTDRWTVEMSLVSTEYRTYDDVIASVPGFAAVRQFRGIANCTPHPELSTGFGNLFLSTSYAKNDIGSSLLFTGDSWINAQAITDHLKNRADI